MERTNRPNKRGSPGLNENSLGSLIQIEIQLESQKSNVADRVNFRGSGIVT